MFIPLSTDMYLPALPSMGEYFDASTQLVGMTLTVFFFVFAVSIVLFGPMSDKYGRKPILLAGTLIYTAASLTCALSADIYMMLIGRFFQALGAGAVITVATVIIKDCFRGELMTRILAITQALAVIAPMAAPIIGGLLLNFTSWRGAFFLLTFLGAINFVAACLLSETLPVEKRYQGSVIGSLSLLWILSKNRRFMWVLAMFSLLAAPYMAYLSVSSFVYIEYFALTAQKYSLFFAINSAAAMLGPLLYLKLKRRMSTVALLKFCFAVSLGAGLAVTSIGHWDAVFFLVAFLPFTIIESAVRPFGMDILLNQAKENAGTASSMINFVQTLFGSIGMMLGTMPWSNFIDGLGIIILASVGLAAIIWQRVGRI